MYFPKEYFLEVYFPKEYFLKVYFLKVYFSKVYLSKVYFCEMYPRVYFQLEVDTDGQQFVLMSFLKAIVNPDFIMKSIFKTKF